MATQVKGHTLGKYYMRKLGEIWMCRIVTGRLATGEYKVVQGFGTLPELAFIACAGYVKQKGWRPYEEETLDFWRGDLK